MFITTILGGTSFTETLYMNWKKQSSDTVRITVVGYVGDFEKKLEYKALLVKKKSVLSGSVDKFIDTLEKGFAQYKEINQGAFDFDKMVEAYGLKAKTVDSVIAKNLIQIYSRATKVNGFFSDWSTLLAISGHVITEHEIRLFIGDLLVAQVPYGLEIDIYVVDKLERASFSKHVSHMDLVKTSYYINDMRRRNTEAYKDLVKDIDLHIEFEDWVSVPLARQEKKKIKKGLFSKFT